MKITKLFLVMFFSTAIAACGGSGSIGGSTGAISATATTTAQSLTVGTAMTSFSPLTPSGGATPYTFSYIGTLPSGLSFSTSAGAVTGTPAAYAIASLVFSVKDANNVVASTTSTVNFTVSLPSWTKQMGAVGVGVIAHSTATDANGNIYVTGQTNGGLDGNSQAGTSDFFLTKYDASGTKLYTKQMGVAGVKDHWGNGYITMGNATATDTNGNVYVTGHTEGGLDGNTLRGNSDFFLMKYNASGTKQ